MLTENLLQFIWKHSLYRVDNLQTVSGETVIVVNPGTWNRNAGPDFLEARVRIGNTLLVGNVELHLKSSDWDAHGHSDDAAYGNIILHVVYEQNNETAPGIPLLVLKDHINEKVVERYTQLMEQPRQIPCANRLAEVKEIVKVTWLERLLAERWEEKLTEWEVMLHSSAEDWRNLLYWRLAANFGFKTNAVPFLMTARSLPLNILARHRHDLIQAEALLFGQAGFLNGTFEDDYPIMLASEYNYLRKKYKLTPIPTHLWKFLRMRPANFPTVRLAQFAQLIHTSEHLFSKIIETHTVADTEPLLNVTASRYWNDHYRFDEPHTAHAPKTLGKDSILNIIINTIAPVQFLYARRQGTDDLGEKALDLLALVKPEKNAITDMWTSIGWKPSNASQSQAQIQLFNKYCSNYRCLECAIGLNLLKA